MRKRLFIIISVMVLLCLALTACSDTQPSTTTTATTTTSEALTSTTSTHPPLESVTLTFDTQGGSEVAPQTLEAGDTPAVPDAPTKVGFAFAGWYYRGQLFDFETPLTESITVSALWETAEYTVRFDTDGGSYVANQKISADGKVTRPANPSKAGFIFAGWQRGDQTYDFSAAVSESFTLTAKWEADTSLPTTYYTVTFDSNGGTAVASQQVLETGLVTRPEDPTLGGKVLDGWYLGSKKYDFTKPVTGDLTLTAQWKDEGETEYAFFTVSFDSDGGSYIKSQSIPEGFTASRPSSPTKDGLAFAGWYLGDEPFAFSTAIIGDITLKAKWVPLSEATYMVSMSYYNKDGDYVIAYQQVKHGNAAADPEDMMTLGHTWSADVSAVTTDMDVRAIYEYKTWRNFALNNENDGLRVIRSGASVGKSSINFTAKGDFISFTYYGDRFISIYCACGDIKSGSLFLTMLDNGVEIGTLELNSSVANGQIRFTDAMANGLHNVVMYVSDVSDDFEGFVFSNSVYYCGTEFTAPYVPDNMATITFDSAGGSAVASQVLFVGAQATKPEDPTREGYTFAGWQLDGAAYNFYNLITGDMTLVATWTEIPSYKVTFDSAGGSAVEAQKVYENAAAVKPADPTRQGYNFMGWQLEGADYDFSAPVTANITLVALWEVNTSPFYTVTFDSAEGSPVQSASIEENKTVARPADPIRDGYRFAGWKLDGADYDFSAPVTSDITLVATWTEIVAGATHTVTFNYYNTAGEYVSSSVTVKDGEAAVAPADMLELGGYTWSADISAVTEDMSVTVAYNYATWRELLLNEANDGVTLTRSGELEYKNNINFSKAGDYVAFTFYGDRFISIYCGAGTNITSGYMIFTMLDNGVKIGSFKASATEGKDQMRFTNTLAQGLHNVVMYVSYVSDDFEGFVYSNSVRFCGSELTAPYTPEGELPMDTAYTVTFDSAGGSEVTAQKVMGGSAATPPDEPTRDGYVFTGWQLDGTDYDFASAVNGDINLVAVWKAAGTFTVTFDTDGGSQVASQTVDENASATRPEDPTKESHRFLGWYVGDAEYDFSAPISADVTITAKWVEVIEGVTHTVTFNYYNTSYQYVSTPVTTADGGTATVPSDVLPIGYTWDIDFSVVTEDLVVTAEYEYITHNSTATSRDNNGVVFQRSDSITNGGNSNFKASGDYIAFTYYGDKQLKIYQSAGGITGYIVLTAVDNGVEIASIKLTADTPAGEIAFTTTLPMGLHNIVIYVSEVSDDFTGQIYSNSFRRFGSTSVPYTPTAADFVYSSEGRHEVTFNNVDSAGAEKLVFKIMVSSEAGRPMPEDPKNGSLKFLGWYCGEEKYEAGVAITESKTYVAKYE